MNRQIHPMLNDFIREACSAPELQTLLALTPSQFKDLESQGVFTPLEEMVFWVDKRNKSTIEPFFKYDTRLNILHYLHYLQPTKAQFLEQAKTLKEQGRALKAFKNQDARVQAQVERIAQLQATIQALQQESQELKSALNTTQAQLAAHMHANTETLATLLELPKDKVLTLRQEGILIREESGWPIAQNLQNYAAFLKNSKEKDPNSLTSEQLSNVLGVTIQRLSQLYHAGVLVKSAKDNWNLTESLKNFITYKLQNEESDLGIARARKELADAKLKELSYKERVGELLTFDTIAKALQDIAMTISNKLYSLPHILKRKHHLDAPFIQTLNEEIEAILSELQDPQVYEQASAALQEQAQQTLELEKLHAHTRAGFGGGYANPEDQI
ncbi:hypothetical protein [Helicobacter salomonis]|uniref:hypothetical protein n=1 Tax=Helicobacter salomonis TaxID=56878 RepID=UPI000CF03E2B|nr:hypothetical protein [Helicobacter salomonis]